MCSSKEYRGGKVVKAGRNIGIIAPLTKEGGGIFQYAISLLEALVGCSKYARNITLIKEPGFSAEILKDVHQVHEVSFRKSGILNKIIKLLYVNFSLARRASLENCGHIDMGEIKCILSPVPSVIPIALKKPYIVTIHDFQHKYYPDFFSKAERMARDFIYRGAAKNAAAVICESESVKQDIAKYLDIPCSKVKIIQSPPPSMLRNAEVSTEKASSVKEKYKLPEKFVFYPAHFWKHKNHLNLIKSIKYIKSKFKEEVFLVLSGGKKDNFNDVMKFVGNSGLSGQVKHLGYISEEDLCCIYKLATILAMPTFFESVSMPIWEAFYMGLPVVSSDVCALPEQVGNAGVLFNPNNPDEMGQKIYEVWTNEDRRKEMAIKGRKRVKTLTPENYSRQLQKVIDEVLVI